MRILSARCALNSRGGHARDRACKQRKMRRQVRIRRAQKLVAHSHASAFAKSGDSGKTFPVGRECIHWVWVPRMQESPMSHMRMRLAGNEVWLIVAASEGEGFEWMSAGDEAAAGKMLHEQAQMSVRNCWHCMRMGDWWRGQAGSGQQ